MHHPLLANATTNAHGAFELNLPSTMLALMLKVADGYPPNCFDGTGLLTGLELPAAAALSIEREHDRGVPFAALQTHGPASAA